MPWKEVRPMDEKVMFIGECLGGGRSFARICSAYGISRKTGYKWLNRYRDMEFEGLVEGSRRPHVSPQQTPYVIRKAIIELRKKWIIPPGPKKIMAVLARDNPEWVLPSRTTIYNILRKEGLVTPRKKRRRATGGKAPFLPANEPNELWSADFKGQFITSDGRWCYPITVMDHASRYLLGCKGLVGTGTKDSTMEFKRIFQEYGLPNRIRTDNGVPFASVGMGGLTSLSVWWIRLGILPERIEPGKPQQNGRHERMHKTLKQGTAQPPGRSAKHQQRLFESFRDEYNNTRPHEGLGQRTPASMYSASTRQMPRKLSELEYPGHYRVVNTSNSGTINTRGICVYVGVALKGQRIGIEEVDDGIWDVFFGPLRLGAFSERNSAQSPYGYVRLKV